MEKQATAQKGSRNDVYSIINDRMLEQLKNGIIPWRVSWQKGGLPTNLISKKQYKGINAILLGMMEYEKNLFLTENQLATIGASILPNEKPHTVAYWNSKDAVSGTDKKTGALGYYKVYNVSQCAGISPEHLSEQSVYTDPIATCERIVAAMPNRPGIKHKEPKAYYNPVSDIVNMPKRTTYSTDEEYYVTLLHLLTHSTGHCTRLDRMGLVQMTELGYPSCSLEELVAEIATGYLQSFSGIEKVVEYAGLNAADWAVELEKNKYLIFTACTLSIKAIDFILGTQDGTENVPVEEE